MTKEFVKTNLDVLKAFAEGKEIQEYKNSCWVDIDIDKDVNFYSVCEYRIKPIPREFLIRKCPTTGYTVISKIDDQSFCCPECIVIKVREVI